MQVIGSVHHHNKRAVVKREKDVRAMVELLAPEQLWEEIPGRYHSSFTDTNLFTGASAPTKFKKCLLQHRETLARRKEYVAQYTSTN